MAGLCHACYGTAGFPHPLLGPDERPVLSALAGARAESLVYLYGSCDRAAVYPALTEPGPVPFRDRFTGRTHTPPESAIRAFTELTAANELDVIRHSPAMAARHGAALRQFFAGARQRLTCAAWQAWSQQPGTDLERADRAWRADATGRHHRPGPPGPDRHRPGPDRWLLPAGAGHAPGHLRRRAPRPGIRQQQDQPASGRAGDHPARRPAHAGQRGPVPDHQRLHPEKSSPISMPRTCRSRTARYRAPARGAR